MKYLKRRNILEFWANDNGASGVLPICTKTKRICIALRSKDVEEPHTWGNFGGAIGKDYYGAREEALSPEDNAKQEMTQEIGFDGQIEMIPSYIYKSGTFRYWNFLGLVDEEFEMDPNAEDSWEVDEIKWVTLSELIQHDDLHFGIHSLIKYDMKQLIKFCR